MSAAVAPAGSSDLAAKPSAVSPQVESEDKDAAGWRPVLHLPCELSVDLRLPRVKVADFLRFRVGSVIGTDWRVAHDVPLRVNGVLIGWGEFEGSGARLAVRLTELA